MTELERSRLQKIFAAGLGCFRFFCIVLIGVLPAWGQFTSVNNATSTPIPGSGHDYIEMLAETVNPSNGSLSLRFQVPIPTGRQFNLPFTFAYDTGGVWTPTSNGRGAGWGFSRSSYLYQSGWSYSVPTLNATQFTLKLVPGLPGPGPGPCVVKTGFVFNDPAGARHQLPIAKLLTFCGPGQTDTSPAGDDYYQAQVDAQGTVLVSSANGTIYKFGQFACCLGGDGNIQSALPNVIEDRNGNIINLNAQPAACPSRLNNCLAETDTMGRLVLSTSGFGITGDTVTVSGLAQPYTVTWDAAPIAFTLPITFQGNPSDGGGVCAPSSSSITAGSAGVISAIALPNGQQFQFSYDDGLGLVSKITYPGGGYVSYTWGSNPQSDYANLADVQGNPGACPYKYDSYAITQRQVSFDGVTVAQEQDFSYSTTWDPTLAGAWKSKQTVVTTHDIIAGKTLKTIYTYTPLFVFPAPYLILAGGIGPQIPLEQTIVYKEGTATLRAVSKTWFDQFELASEQTTLDNGLTDQVTYTYGPGAQITERDEFDYGQGTPGPLLRKSTISYASFPASPLFPSAPSLLDRPATKITYDSAGKQVAETVYCYDQPPPTDTSATNIVQHDYKHYSSSFNVRGNLTQQLQWLNIPGQNNPSPTCGQNNSSNAVSVTYAYDDTGQRTSATDALGNTATYTYDATDAFLIQTKSPIPGLPHGGGVALTTSATYDFNSGRLLSTTDPNGQATSYTYDDPLNRLTGITRPPGGGSTAISYGDVAPHLYVHVLEDLDETRKQESYDYFDGFGHTIRSLKFDGTQGTPWVVHDSYYDGLGRPALVSTPYRTAAPSPDRNPCGPCISSSYDALGRIKLLATPDGAQTLTSYSGNTVTVTDQAQMTKTTIDDALGRLTQVIENPSQVNGEPSLTTSYIYDVLDNLVSVAQGQQRRYFVYDSLGRLLRRSNPEESINPALALADPLTGNSQWAEAFTYDADGNLTDHTDSRGITAHHLYDVLNRETEISYANAPSNTPTLDWFYDGAGLPPGASGGNELGRVTKVNSSDSASGSYTYDGYSPTGRVLQTTQTVDGQAYTIQYAYNLAGHLVSETYPSGRIVTTAMDDAGQISSVGSLSNPIPYAASIQYAPHGGVASLMLGNHLWEHTLYDPNRLQQTEIGVGTSAGASDLLKLTYDYGKTNNNGNVLRQVMTVPTTAPGESMVVTELAKYDSVNRILAAQEVNGDTTSWQPTAIWEQDFGYDQYGNRTGLTSTALLPTMAPPPVDPASNRIDVTKASGYSYDPAGNLTQQPTPAGATNVYTYDANNRLIQSQEGSSIQVFKYNALGHRIKKTAGGASTVFVYDAAGQLITEYTTGSAASNGTRYVSQDSLGSERLITDRNQNGVARYDLLPYGELIPSGLGARGSVAGYATPGVLRQLFTGKERDSETGLDYFGARYYASWIGRFTSTDPTFQSALHTDPQSWNRYTYVLNRPLVLVDPNGELWEATGDANNPYKWVDRCERGHTCYDQIAVQVGETVRIYGPNHTLQTYRTNEHGYIDLAAVARAHGSYFRVVAPGVHAYVSPQTAVDVYNAAFDYHLEYTHDANLVVTSAGNSNGTNFRPHHNSHNLGKTVDLRYMDNDGHPVQGARAIFSADDTRMQRMVQIFRENGFNEMYSDDNNVYRTQWAAGHLNHIHIGKTAHTGQCEIGPCGQARQHPRQPPQQQRQQHQ